MNLNVYREELTSLVEAEISNAEDYLDSNIRSQISENHKFYEGKLPVPATNGSKFVDNTVFTHVEHMLANTMEAFGSDDLLEITPDDPSDAIAVSVVTEVINDVFDVTNNRRDVFQGWFKDALTTKNGILKVYKDIESNIRTEYFNDIDATLLPELEYQLSSDGADVNTVITEERTESIQSIDPLQQIAITVEQTFVSGYFEFKEDREVVRTVNILNENFIIDADAKRITDARCVGHKANIPFGELVELGFDEDVLKEVFENLSSDSDVEDNVATSSRRATNYGGDTNEVSQDVMMKEVTLYELYVRTSIPNQSKDTFKQVGLYQVFYVNGVLLSCKEVNFAPYVDIVPFGSAHTFWGESYTDKLKDIQRAKTGIIRGYMEGIARANRPRYMYTQGKVDERSLMSTVNGAHIALKDGGVVGLAPTSPMPAGVDNLGSYLDKFAQDISGVSFQGQGLIADAIKSGGSTATASMALSQMQMYEKYIIKSFAARGVQPLVRMVYRIIREQFSEYTVRLNGQPLTINPSIDLPASHFIDVRTELGSNAKMEKVLTLMAHRDFMVNSANSKVQELYDAKTLHNINKTILSLQGVQLAETLMLPVAEINTNQQVQMVLAQMQGQLTGLTQQVQTLTVERDQLLQLNNERVMRELELKEQKQLMDGEIAADKHKLEERKFKHTQEVDADKQALAEVKVDAEILNPAVSFN